jgi:branched-subunit amino acid aminotransferase/4-amino-4-deoxychorismate lyase
MFDGSGTGRAVWVDGSFQPAEAAVFDAFSTALRAGEGVFETLAARRGQPTLPLHLERLEWAAGRLGSLPLPAHDYAAVLDALLERAGLAVARARLALYPPEAQPRVVFTVEPMPDLAAARQLGLRLVTSPFRRGPDDPTAPLKVESRAFWRLVRRQARQLGADDALVLGDGGELRETSTANVFLVDAKGAVWTPTLDDSFLAGITRGRLLAALRRSGQPVEERTIYRSALRSAREVFLTNAVHGVLPVAAVDDLAFPVPGQLERWLALLDA